jgi:hypothetical protein
MDCVPFLSELLNVPDQTQTGFTAHTNPNRVWVEASVSSAKMRPMVPIDSRRSVPFLVVFTVVFSSFFSFLIAKSGHSGAPHVNYVGCLMWRPGLAALIACKHLGRDLSTLGWN